MGDLQFHCCVAASGATQILCVALTIYWLILLVRIFSSWFPTPRSGILRAILSFTYQVTDPILRPLRNVIPPLRMGAVGMDLSPIVVFIGIGVLKVALRCGPGFF